MSVCLCVAGMRETLWGRDALVGFERDADHKMNRLSMSPCYD